MARKIKQYFSGEWCKHGRKFIKNLGNRRIRIFSKELISKELNEHISKS